MAVAKIGIEVKGATALNRAMKALGETDAPFLGQAIDDGGKLLQGAVRPRAPGGMASKVEFSGVKGSGANLRALVKVKHPGAKSMEFGRTKYYEAFTGRRQKATGRKVTRRGQQARPFVGVRNMDRAVGAVKPDIQVLIERAYTKEWDRLAGGPD